MLLFVQPAFDSLCHHVCISVVLMGRDTVTAQYHMSNWKKKDVGYRFTLKCVGPLTFFSLFFFNSKIGLVPYVVCNPCGCALAMHLRVAILILTDSVCWGSCVFSPLLAFFLQCPHIFICITAFLDGIQGFVKIGMNTALACLCLNRACVISWTED